MYKSKIRIEKKLDSEFKESDLEKERFNESITKGILETTSCTSFPYLIYPFLHQVESLIIRKRGSQPCKTTFQAQVTEKANKQKSDSLYYVGIGASAGGLEALRPFVANLPLQSNMTFIIAQHMSPDHKSLMVELLIRETSLKVEEARHNTLPAANTIYVAPPNSDITITGGKIRISKPHNNIGPKPSVDRFFMSLADDQEDRAIGIILSGTGSDGAHGTKAIKTAGGITIAQEPTSAKYDSMPKSAVRSGGADLSLTPQDIAIQLSSIVARPRTNLVVDDDEEKSPPSTIRGIIQQIIAHTGMDFSNYKDATISRQVLRRMTALQISTLEEYGEHIAKHREELHELAGNFLICVTSFFRDQDAFDVMRNELRSMLKGKAPGDDIRIWVPGCASGEEVYSIAMLISEELMENRDKYHIQIFATDINQEAVQMARLGVYSEASLAGVDGNIIKKYFSAHDGMFKIDNSLKEMVLFARQDLVQDPPFVRLDMISCRNLLIYFKLELQDRVFKIFHYALRTSGILFLGKSETIGKHSALFSEKDRKHKLYIKRDVSTPIVGGFSRIQSLLHSKLISSEKNQPVTPGALGHERLFDLYVPPSLLITTDGEIIEFFGDCSNYLTFKKGKADFNIFNIINPAFRAELRAFVHRVARSRESTRSNPINITVEGKIRPCYMTVHFVETRGLPDSELLIVSFDMLDEKKLLDPATNEESATTGLQRITDLEQEVTLTRENLQTVIEELETANEELQSLNEEAQASNEELQASNEELETANEELQASNEELITVNDELTTRTQELAETNNDLENILNSLHKAILVVDRSLNITRYNRMAQEFFVILPGQVSNLTGVSTTFELPNFLDRIGTVLKKAEPLDCEFRKNENVYLMRLMPYVSSLEKMVGGTVISIEDITEKKVADEKLKLSASVFESASEATLVTDANNRILSVNPAFTKITGYTQEEVIGKNPKVLSSGKQSREFFKNMWETLISTGTWRGEIWNKRKNTQIYPEWLTINLLRDESGSIFRFIAVFSDITDSKKSQELIERQANFDTLTELPNRNLMMDRLEQLLVSSRRSREIFAVLYMDLDDFKTVNDSLGHHNGDELLRKTGIRLREVLRETDSVGRLGGDEFLVLLSSLTKTDDIVPIVNKILTELSRPLFISGHELHTAASIGITVYPTDGESSDILLRNADGAMYEAKKAGRNTFCFFTHGLQDEANRRHWIANELAIALRYDRLMMYYQPILDLQSGQIVGCEALLRWNHPQKGFIPPEDFITVAEQNGMIGKVGQWVFKRALQEANKWTTREGLPLRLSLNLSPGQFLVNGDMDELLRMIEASELARREAIIIEITESLRLSERKEYIASLERFRELGCKIAIDDFGTGFSSLNYIRQLPIDIVKIDKSFISDVTNDIEDAAMVKAILTMADSLNLSVVAEGIETSEQLDFLKKFGCKYGQGFLFSKPLPVDQFIAFTQPASE